MDASLIALATETVTSRQHVFASAWLVGPGESPVCLLGAGPPTDSLSGDAFLEVLHKLFTTNQPVYTPAVASGFCCIRVQSDIALVTWLRTRPALGVAMGALRDFAAAYKSREVR